MQHGFDQKSFRKIKKLYTKVRLNKKIVGFLLIVLSVFILAFIDWKSGYEYDFFVFYFIPVSIAAWTFSIEASIIVSMLCALLWFFADKLSGQVYSTNIVPMWNTFIRLGCFMLISWFLNKINKLFHSEKSKALKLEKALSELKILQSFLSICSVCKKIRDEEGNWEQMEKYISEHSDTRFSHGYCPECAQKALKEIGLIERESK